MTLSTGKTTLRPWVLKADERGEYSVEHGNCTVMHNDGFPPYAVSIDDAGLIVRAVNAHEALVSALEAMCEEQRHPSPAYEAARKLLASLE